jgi:Mor family transcriptional regulator
MSNRLNPNDIYRGVLMRNEKQSKVIRMLQDAGYRGKAVYVQKRHPGDRAPVCKFAGIIEDNKRGLSKLEIAKKYETSVQYIYYVLSNKTANKTTGKGLKYELWQEVVDAYPSLKKTGGYLNVPIKLLGRDGSFQNGYKTMLIQQEFERGNFNAKEIAEKYDTTTVYVYKLKSEWIKRGR